MAIKNVLVNVSDVARSVDFYSGLLSGVVVGRSTEDRSVLDFLTATVELHRVEGAIPCTWQADDHVSGFRHVGFKVDRLDPLVGRLKAAGVQFHIEPADAVGGVRIAFFFDPDGTVLEIVEGPLQYHEVHDPEGVAAELALGTPVRPRFDHVGVTAHDLRSISERYAPLGFANIGTLVFADDPRGFRIDYLKGGDSVLEVFTFAEHPMRGTTRVDALGFLAMELDGPAIVPYGARPAGEVEGRVVHVDDDQIPVTVGRWAL